VSHRGPPSAVGHILTEPHLMALSAVGGLILIGLGLRILKRPESAGGGSAASTGDRTNVGRAGRRPALSCSHRGYRGQVMGWCGGWYSEIGAPSCESRHTDTWAVSPPQARDHVFVAIGS